MSAKQGQGRSGKALGLQKSVIMNTVTPADTLAALRRDLDFIPSSDPEHPGLYIRDARQYSSATLLIPPPLVELLNFFDGASTTADLREAIFRLTGELNAAGLIQHLRSTLSQAGFLEDAVFARLRDARHAEFAAAPSRLPAHAGSSYPDESIELQATFDRYFAGSRRAAANGVQAIAAPHVSPEGGWECYRDAYQALAPELGGRTFVILGTSHQGEPDRFGLTRKNYVTPLGEAMTDQSAVAHLERAAPGSVRMEDYCHAFEHSIEFQVIFLQRLYGPGVKVLPILCGPFLEGLYRGPGRWPEDSEAVKRFLGELGTWAAGRDDLAWVLGIDLAHMGRRYGDPRDARADVDEMATVAGRDRDRLSAAARGDARGFWEQVRERQDDLKWCGSAPLYSLLSIRPRVCGELVRYQQWNIDPHSVVSFAGLTWG